MHYVVKPCGTFGVREQDFIFWVNAFDYAIDLIESSQYSQVMIGKQDGDTYEPLGYIKREDGVMRWVAYCGPPAPMTVLPGMGYQYRGIAIPCS